jgi:hypothetical protein
MTVKIRVYNNLKGELFHNGSRCESSSFSHHIPVAYSICNEAINGIRGLKNVISCEVL